MPITSFLDKKGFPFNSLMGNCRELPQQVDDLIDLTNKPNINVMEI